jgi:hypothetical protein
VDWSGIIKANGGRSCTVIYRRRRALTYGLRLYFNGQRPQATVALRLPGAVGLDLLSLLTHDCGRSAVSAFTTCIDLLGIRDSRPGAIRHCLVRMRNNRHHGHLRGECKRQGQH